MLARLPILFLFTLAAVLVSCGVLFGALLRDPVTGALWRRDVGGGGPSNLLTDDNGDECCCGGGCCQCDRSATVCCYHADDILTLVVQKTFSLPRHCTVRCDGSNKLTCFDCIDYLDSNDYTLSVCDGETIEWVRVGSDTCFPKWIRRTCGEDEWKPYNDADVLVTWESLPLCGLCTQTCSVHDGFPCGSIDPCDLTLTCCSDGESSISSPPSPYTICTHNDGAAVGGTGYCFCVGAGCYHFDLKAWIPLCTFTEDSEGGCTGGATEAQICAVVEVSFTIAQHCEPNGSGGCRRIAA